MEPANPEKVKGIRDFSTVWVMTPQGIIVMVIGSIADGNEDVQSSYEAHTTTFCFESYLLDLKFYTLHITHPLRHPSGATISPFKL